MISFKYQALLLAHVCRDVLAEGADKPAKSVAVVSDFEIAATNAAAMFGNDEQFTKHVEEFIVAGETVRMGSLTLFMDVNANNSDLLASLPPLDTKEGKPGAGNNPEYRKINSPKADGTQGEKYVSFYTILADQFPAGKQITATLADLKKRKDNGSILPVSYERDSKKWNARRQALRRVFRQMGKLYHHFDAFNAFPLVTAKPAMLETENGMVLCQSAEPIIVQSVSNVQDFKAMSVDAFLRLDIAEAVKKAGGADKVTKAHLMATVNRDGAEKKLKPLAMTTYPDYVSGVWNFTDANSGAILSRIHKRDAEGKALAVAMYRLQLQIGDMIDPLGKELAAWVDADDKATAAANAKKTGTNN